MKRHQRIHSIDVARGIVMIIMALDHVRDLLHRTALTQNPLDLNTTSGTLFFTRWVTHLCAPTFVFLSGVSVFLLKEKLGPAKSKSFLLKRGVWLILLELIVVNFALSFDVRFRAIIFLVVAAIGTGYLLLSIFQYLPRHVVLFIAVVLIGGHEWIASLAKSQNSAGAGIFGFLFEQKLFTITPHFLFLVSYPPLPWFGIMLLGFWFAPVFRRDRARRLRSFCLFGFLGLFLFVLLRWMNGYGDPSPWALQRTAGFTALSFLNVSKYPPSLEFTSLFLGGSFFLLLLGEFLKGKLVKIVSVYGSVPLFYYVVHLYLVRLAVFIVVFMQGFNWNDLQFTPFAFGKPAGPSGVSLWLVYAVWITIVAGLYPLCRWYGRFKQRSTHLWWVHYI